MATHSSILAWKILWMEETGRLQSMGSQRVGHDWAHQRIYTGKPKKFLWLTLLQYLLYCGGQELNPQYLQGMQVCLGWIESGESNILLTPNLRDKAFSSSSLHMIVVVDLLKLQDLQNYKNKIYKLQNKIYFLRLRKTPSILSLLRVFTQMVYTHSVPVQPFWFSLSVQYLNFHNFSNAFSATIKMIIWGFFIILLMYWITLIDVQMLNCIVILKYSLPHHLPQFG